MDCSTVSLCKAGLWHLPRLSSEEPVECNVFMGVGGSIETSPGDTSHAWLSSCLRSFVLL